MKPIEKARQDYDNFGYLDDRWIDDTEDSLFSMAKKLLSAGYSEMKVFRILGLTSEKDWEWLRSIK